MGAAVDSIILCIQEEGKTKMVDNILMAAPAQVTHNIMESTASPTHVTTHTQNNTDTDTKNFTRVKMVEREAIIMEIIIFLHPRILVWFV